MKALDKFDAQHPQSTINPHDQFIVSEEKLSKEPASCDQNAQAVSGERGTGDVEPELRGVIFEESTQGGCEQYRIPCGPMLQRRSWNPDGLEMIAKHMRWRERQSAKRTTPEVKITDEMVQEALSKNLGYLGKVYDERDDVYRRMKSAIAAALAVMPKEAK